MYLETASKARFAALRKLAILPLQVHHWGHHFKKYKLIKENRVVYIFGAC